MTVAPQRLKRPSRQELIDLIEREGTKAGAGRAIGVPRQTIHRWCDELKIEVKRTARAA